MRRFAIRRFAGSQQGALSLRAATGASACSLATSQYTLSSSDPPCCRVLPMSPVTTPPVSRPRRRARTDGACAPSNPGPSAWGAVIVGPDGLVAEEVHGFIGHGTNQIAELTAAIEGLLRVPEGVPVELVSDSQYVLKGLSEWRAGWERKGFRNSRNEPVANLDLWKRLFVTADARRVTVRWVRGHNGDPLNERADSLANEALRLAAARR
jgi:ribonuclease HI